jgi:hypothetical protein
LPWFILGQEEYGGERDSVEAEVTGGKVVPADLGMLGTDKVGTKEGKIILDDRSKPYHKGV